MKNLTSKLVSHYRILEELGAGGMGIVYKAEDVRLGRFVALKFLPERLGTDTVILQRFQREARAASALSHPNICTIFDIGEYNDSPFIVMEFLEGITLRQRLASGPFDLDQFLSLAIQIARALETAHSNGVIHRDIKPANIFITKQGQAKITDFGLAKLMPSSELDDSSDLSTVPDEGLTNPGIAMGTISYMSPEQARGEDLDGRSDLFSFGVALYEMACGTQPFKGKTAALLFDEILNKTPEPPSVFNQSVDFDVEQLILKTLAKNPEDRFQSAKELLVDLLRIQREHTSSSVAVRSASSTASIAVLPFTDLSPGKDQEYFCDGLAEELINALTRIRGLQVASRTSSFAFKGRTMDVRQIGAKLNVRTVLEGSVRKADKKLRITAQLVNVANGYHLISKRFDRELEDVFSIQEEIAQSIVNALQLELKEEERRALEKAPTRDVEAFEFYLRGRQFFYRSKKRAVEFALQMFSKAIRKDPKYSLAYAGMADCYSYLFMYFEHSQENLEKAAEASKKALELDIDLAEAHASRGLAISLSNDYEDAEREFEYAILLNPRLFEAYYFYARTCFAQGKLKKAARLYRLASKANPPDYQALNLLAFTYRSLKLKDKARAAYERGLSRVEKHLELNPDDSRALYLGAEALLALGNRERAFLWANRAYSIDREDPYIVYGIACLHARAGVTDKAIEYFQMAVDAGFAHREWIENDVDLDPIRRNPRFQDTLAQLK